MPKAIMQNDMARPKQDSMVAALKVPSATIEEIVFIAAPFFAQNGH